MADKLTAMAQALRGWQEENPWKDAAAGFVPGVGQVELAAALRDPKATTTDKVLAGVGAVPGGAAVTKLGGAALGAMIPLIRRGAIQAPKGWEKIMDTVFRPMPGVERVEIPDHDLDMVQFTKQWGDMLRGAGKGGATTTTPLDKLYTKDSLFMKAMPEIQSMSVDWSRKANGPYNGMYFPKEKRIALYPGGDDAAGTLRHEATHAADHTGAGGAGDLDNPASRMFEQWLDGSNPMYLMQPGELFGRMVKVRADWTPKQRAALPLQKQYDDEMKRLKKVFTDYNNPGFRHPMANVEDGYATMRRQAKQLKEEVK